MAKVLQIVVNNKAEKIYRFINYIIDFIVSIIIIWLLIAIFSVIRYFVFGVELEQTAYDLENIDSLVDRVVTILVYALIMFFIEKFTNGRSLGKLITGTKVVKVDGTPLTNDDLLKRNFSRAIPFDNLSFLGDKGWHDNWSDTRVVKIKDYKNARRLENDIANLGKQENL